MPDKTNEKRRPKIPKARYRVQNWRDYDAARHRRGDLTMWVTPAAMAAWTPLPCRRWGRSRAYFEIAVVTGLMLRLGFGRPWRHTEGMLASILRLLGLDHPAPDHTTFSRRSANLNVAKALRTARRPVNVVIDSTGLKVFGAGEWQREKHGGQGRRTWRRLHFAVNPDIGEAIVSELRTAEDGDASQVGPMLDQISSPIASVAADGAYDGEPVYRTVAERDPVAGVIIPPWSTAVPSRSAEAAAAQRDRHLRLIQERGRLGWQKTINYGRRSLGVVAMMCYETLIGRRLPRPDSANAKDRSRGGLQGHQCHDQLRHAGSQRLA